MLSKVGCCIRVVPLVGITLGHAVFSNVMSDLPRLIGESLDRCSANSKGRSLLVLQDSTEFNYTPPEGKRRIKDPDIGTLDNSSQTGFFLHPCLVLDQAQAPLGYSSISFAHRPFDQANKKARKYGSLPIKEKESYKWIESAQSSKQTFAEAEHLLLISARQSDIYQYLMGDRTKEFTPMSKLS